MFVCKSVLLFISDTRVTKPPQWCQALENNCDTWIKQPKDCDSQLGATCPYSHPLFRQAIVTHKLGNNDLVFCVPSLCITRSVRARLQVCVQQLRFVPPWSTSRQTHTHRQHFDQFIWKAQPAELKTTNEKMMWLRRNMCHGAPKKSLDFGDIWPWVLSLIPILVYFFIENLP